MLQSLKNLLKTKKSPPETSQSTCSKKEKAANPTDLNCIEWALSYYRLHSQFTECLRTNERLVGFVKELELTIASRDLELYEVNQELEDTVAEYVTLIKGLNEKILRLEATTPNLVTQKELANAKNAALSSERNVITLKAEAATLSRTINSQKIILDDIKKMLTLQNKIMSDVGRLQ